MAQPPPGTPAEGTYSRLHVAPFSEAERARKLVGMTGDQMAAFLGVSSRTYGRRRKAGALSEAESVKVAFLTESLRLAEEVFRDVEHASAWIRSPLLAFGRRTPIEMLHSVRGYEQVKDTLNRIRYGMLQVLERGWEVIRLDPQLLSKRGNTRAENLAERLSRQGLLAIDPNEGFLERLGFAARDPKGPVRTPAAPCRTAR